MSDFLQPEVEGYEARLDGLRRWAERLFIAGFAAEILLTLLDLFAWLTWPATWNDPTAMPDDGELALAMVIVAAGLVWLGVYLGGVVMFLRWEHRLGTTSHLFAGQAMTYSPGWAVGWWFVPFANLVMPYRVLKELFEVNDPAAGESARGVAPTSLLNQYWALWIVSAVFATFADRLAVNAAAAGVVAAVSLLLSFGLLVRALQVMRRLTEAHVARLNSGDAAFDTCPTCRYNLTGTPGDTCPECGTRFRHAATGAVG